MFRDEDSDFATIPATPGWHICVLYSNTDNLSDEPIVAWEIERWASPNPDLHGKLLQRRFCTERRMDAARPDWALP